MSSINDSNPINQSSNSLSVTPSNPTRAPTNGDAIARNIASSTLTNGPTETAPPLMIVTPHPTNADLDSVVSLQFKKIKSPEEKLKDLKGVIKELDNVHDAVKAVHKKGCERAKKLKVPHGVINHLHKNELMKLENELYELGGNIQTAKRKFDKNKTKFDELPEDSPIKADFQDSLNELERKIKAAEKDLDQQLTFHQLSRLTRLFDMIARILHEVNEGIRVINQLR